MYLPTTNLLIFPNQESGLEVAEEMAVHDSYPEIPDVAAAHLSEFQVTPIPSYL